MLACNEKTNAIFFGFGAQDSRQSLLERLGSVKNLGISHIIASYKTQGMKQAQFDEDYFAALDCLVVCCKEMGISFWLEDYAPFPTGSANGAYAQEQHAHLNKQFIDERHIDLVGPADRVVVRMDALTSATFAKSIHLFQKTDPGCRRRIGVVAYRLQENTNNAAAPHLEEDTAVILDDCVQDGYLRWNVPQGRWRVFALFTTFESSGRANFMNLLSKESVALEIEQVHKPLYEHLKEELGKTWTGFFYDEPEIGNDGGENVFDFFMLPGRRSRDMTDIEVYPWSPEMPKEMEARDKDWLKKLPCLWYDGLDAFRDFRATYMDAVSALVCENYNGQVYAFCRERGIRYTGHVLEDENCHTRMGCGPGHYFRQQYWQDEAGIDVIAGQILPGRDGATSWYGVANSDGEFNHYGLAKLASSEAHINPLKRNRSVTECFAMYGQQGLSERKFLIDHLMVNGINGLLFADIPTYQAPVEYGSMLVEYAQRLCSLLRASQPVTETAILYHAESEWREGEKAQKFQKPAAALARRQIGYDVIPADVFAFPERYRTETEDGLMINGHAYRALIIPATSKLPASVERFVRSCEKTGFPVFFVDCVPETFREKNATSLAELADAVAKRVCPDVIVEQGSCQWLRCAHVRQGGQQWYLLHNEDPREAVELELSVAAEQRVLLWDPMYDTMSCPEQEQLQNGRVRIHLSLGHFEMQVLVVPEKKIDVPMRNSACGLIHTADWELVFPDGMHQSGKSLPHPEDHTGFDWYGKLVYKTTFTADGLLPTALDLGQVSDLAEVFVNGESAGKRLASPYRFDVSGKLHPGSNEIEIEVYTSAGNLQTPVKIFGVAMDTLTAVPYTTVEPMGILGPVKWIYGGGAND